MWWSDKNVKVSLTLSIPPDWEINLPSKVISLFLFDSIGSNTAPDPFPPSIVTDKTFCISKSCGSICMSVISPITTGWTKAFVPPVDGEDTSKVGGTNTS